MHLGAELVKTELLMFFSLSGTRIPPVNFYYPYPLASRHLPLSHLKSTIFNLRFIPLSAYRSQLRLRECGA